MCHRVDGARSASSPYCSTSSRGSCSFACRGVMRGHMRTIALMVVAAVLASLNISAAGQTEMFPDAKTYEEKEQIFLTRLPEKFSPEERAEATRECLARQGGVDPANSCSNWYGLEAWYQFGWRACDGLRRGYSREFILKELLLPPDAGKLNDAIFDTAVEVLCPKDVLDVYRREFEQQLSEEAAEGEDVSGIRLDAKKDQLFIERMLEEFPELERSEYRNQCRTHTERCPFWGFSIYGDNVCRLLREGHSRAEILEGESEFFGRTTQRAIVDAAIEVICPEFMGRRSGKKVARGVQPEDSAGTVTSRETAKATEPLQAAEAGRTTIGAPTGAIQGPVCKRDASAEWESFFCRYMTESLWVAAGKPAVPDPQGGPPWTPLFYRHGTVCVGECETKASAAPVRPDHNPLADGLLEGLQQESRTGEGSPIRRYAPWSTHVKSALGCSEAQVVNPYRLSSGVVPRAQLLGLGWAQVAHDAADPTDALGPGAMFILYTAANLGRLYDEPLASEIDADSLYAIGHGTLRVSPDFERNAQLWLVRPDGRFEAVRDLSKAIELAAKGAVVFVNDALRNQSYASGEADAVAAFGKQPVLLLYLAQDFFAPWADNPGVRAMLRGLAEGVAKRGASLYVTGHGWGGFLAISELRSFRNVTIRALNPYPNPWHLAEYSRALDESKAKIEVIAGDRDFVMMLGGGPGSGATQPNPAPCW